MPGLGGASAGSPPIHAGMSATGLLPVVVHPASRLAMRKRGIRLGFISRPLLGFLGFSTNGMKHSAAYVITLAYAAPRVGIEWWRRAHSRAMVTVIADLLLTFGPHVGALLGV